MSDDPDFEYLIVGSTVISAHQHAAGAKRGEDQVLGRFRSGLSTKIHMAVCGFGCPVRFALTAGQKGNAPQPEPLIDGRPADVVMRPELLVHLTIAPERRSIMGMNKPKDGPAGTTDQSPRWEGPEANRPRGYLPAKDDPDVDRDAVGENNRDPERNRPSDAMKVKEDAKGQFAGSQADPRSTGVASAKPTVVTGSEDATAHRTPPGQKGAKKDWDVNFDETEPDRSK